MDLVDVAEGGPFAEHVAAAVGHAVWNPRQGHGSFLTFELGPGRRDSTGHVNGEWHLWIQMAAWRIEDGATVLAACEDDRDVVAAALAAVDGRPLTAVTASGPALDTVFSFGDVHVRTFTLWSGEGDRDADSWMLFRPDGQVLTVSPGGVWTLGPAGVA
ncbi:hypothetical protein [Cellulomonas iranensis]|uniref:hypothetical protein n=1 Tax=Cellulomonas iranensis TaxID=76862 RepID=UPI001177F28E|nr:hypothetical protein [Cellulomonas iranensis]